MGTASRLPAAIQSAAARQSRDAQAGAATERDEEEQRRGQYQSRADNKERGFPLPSERQGNIVPERGSSAHGIPNRFWRHKLGVTVIEMVCKCL